MSEHPALLADTYGRHIRDLRVSLTDRCNLRCTYCMPAEGLDWLAKEDHLTVDETVRVVRIAVEQGVTDVRFTGGEPLLRKGLEEIIAKVAQLNPRPRIAMTTNAIGLSRRAAALKEAGLDRINVSLDTVNPETFARLARRDRLDDVLAGLEAAQEAGLDPVKINSVPMRGYNDHEMPELLRYCLRHGYELRFIEQMPLDAQHQWRRENMVTAAEMREKLAVEFELSDIPVPNRGSAPAEKFAVRGTDTDGSPLSGTVGIIASVTQPFCGDCDRMRITADGQVRNCLFSHREDDLRELLRNEGSDADIAARMARSIHAKLPGHGINDPSFLQPRRPMSAIGG